ncbi:unnamed protein product [Auanema sp. JU1783]|nr:unnamed protein product [Auanema sp. JU1783]
MWECEFEVANDEEDEPGFRANLNIGKDRTAKYLSEIVDRNLNKLPLPIIASWQMKNTRFSGKHKKKTACGYCGINLQSSKTLSLNVKVNTKDVRTLYGKCNACGSKLYAGKLKALHQDDLNASVLNQTSDTLNSSISSTLGRSLILSAQKLLTSTPKNKGIPPSPSLSTLSKSKKKKGSALSKLLQDDDSEKDRSLNSFLNSFSR